jgi:hypothetical protein
MFRVDTIRRRRESEAAMSDNEEKIYEPTVRPREREDHESDTLDPCIREFLRVWPGTSTPKSSATIEIVLPTIHEVPLVPGPDLEQ